MRLRQQIYSMLVIGFSCDVAVGEPVTTSVWQEVVVSVTEIERTAKFFEDIGGYEEKWRGPLEPGEIRAWGLPPDASGESLVLGPANQNSGLLRLIRFDGAGRKEPTRPGSRSWDTGCYFSVMVRMKDMPSIYDDAIRLGWWSETPITQLSFGDSFLNVMVFLGPDGLQVQGYERLSLPLPEKFPEFDRFSGPFNMMQMVRDRDVSYDFYTRVLGFDTFYKGDPFVSEEPEYMPLGIPKNLTTTSRYRAGIVYPVAGEMGRMETIEMMDLEGRDFSARCDAPNLGILAVRFPVEDIDEARKTIEARGAELARLPIDARIEPYGDVTVFSVKTPDGANIQFFDAAE